MRGTGCPIESGMTRPLRHDKVTFQNFSAAVAVAQTAMASTARVAILARSARLSLLRRDLTRCYFSRRAPRPSSQDQDLGKDTASIGAQMSAFDPGPGWKDVESDD